jgi:hypothetical protein
LAVATGIKHVFECCFLAKLGEGFIFQVFKLLLVLNSVAHVERNQYFRFGLGINFWGFFINFLFNDFCCVKVHLRTVNGFFFPNRRRCVHSLLQIELFLPQRRDVVLAQHYFRLKSFNNVVLETGILLLRLYLFLQCRHSMCLLVTLISQIQNFSLKIVQVTLKLFEFRILVLSIRIFKANIDLFAESPRQDLLQLLKRNCLPRNHLHLVSYSFHQFSLNVIV